MRWPLQPLQPLQQTQLQPPFVQSVDSLCHPWFTTTNVSYRFPILKLPPPPCAVLLVIYPDKRWLVGGVEHLLFSISYIRCHPSHWRSPSFFKMVIAPPTRWWSFNHHVTGGGTFLGGKLGWICFLFCAVSKVGHDVLQCLAPNWLYVLEPSPASVDLGIRLSTCFY